MRNKNLQTINNLTQIGGSLVDQTFNSEVDDIRIELFEVNEIYIYGVVEYKLVDYTKVEVKFSCLLEEAVKVEIFNNNEEVVYESVVSIN